MSKRDPKEARLHTEIVREFRNFRIEKYKGELFPGLSELLATSIGGTIRALGAIKNLPDLFYALDGKLYGIELKAPQTSHNVEHLIEQADWMIKHCEKGWFCDNMEGFFLLLDGDSNGGYDAGKVKEYCLGVKTKMVEWNKVVEGVNK